MDKNEKEYRCEKCNFETNIKQAYEKHLETEKHKTGKNKVRFDKKYPDKCELCNFIFSFESSSGFTLLCFEKSLLKISKLLFVLPLPLLNGEKLSI